MIPMHAIPMAGKLINMGRVNTGALHQCDYLLECVCLWISEGRCCFALSSDPDWPCGCIGAWSAPVPATGGSWALLYSTSVAFASRPYCGRMSPLWVSANYDLLRESISYNHSGKRSIIADIDLMHRENWKGRNKNRIENIAFPLHSWDCACKT